VAVRSSGYFRASCLCRCSSTTCCPNQQTASRQTSFRVAALWGSFLLSDTHFPASAAHWRTKCARSCVPCHTPDYSVDSLSPGSIRRELSSIRTRTTRLRLKLLHTGDFFMCNNTEYSSSGHHDSSAVLNVTVLSLLQCLYCSLSSVLSDASVGF